jgi:peroxiredoxin
MDKGDKAPLSFSIPGTTGSQDFEKYTISEYIESGPLVLAFYPFDFSPVCVSELCKFRDAEWLTVTENLDLFGISRDACYSHSRFIEEYDLPFPLLSDIEGNLTEAFGVKYKEWELHEGVPKRAVFIIDSEGVIQYKWSSDDAYDNPDVEELARQIAALPSTSFQANDLLE